MKELNGPNDQPILNTHYLITRRRNPKKRWMIAKSRSHYDTRAMHNGAMEIDYHRVIAIVKTHMADGEIFFERDYKYDFQDGIFGMHTLFTQHFFWTLVCSLDYQYQITIGINEGCPYADVIRPLLNAYPLDRVMEITPSKAEFDRRFANTLLAQDPCYHITLKGNHS